MHDSCQIISITIGSDLRVRSNAGAFRDLATAASGSQPLLQSVKQFATVLHAVGSTIRFAACLVARLQVHTCCTCARY